MARYEGNVQMDCDWLVKRPLPVLPVGFIVCENMSESVEPVGRASRSPVQHMEISETIDRIIRPGQTDLG